MLLSAMSHRTTHRSRLAFRLGWLGRIGTKQPRGVRFENGLMILIPPPRVIDGVTEHREISAGNRNLH